MKIHRVLAGVAILWGFGAAVVGLTPTTLPNSLAREIQSGSDHISALDLAERILKSRDAVLLVDLRTQAEFNRAHIPTARAMSISQLVREPLPRDKTIVVYSEAESRAAQAWVLLRLRGCRNVRYLREGLYEWMARVSQPRLAVDATPAERLEFERAARLSRSFGGDPISGVSRGEIPAGYWTESSKKRESTEVAPDKSRMRRGGC